VKEEAKISRNTFVELTFLIPARYLKLFEIIPGPQTSSEVDFLTIYGEFLGTSVVAKDIQRCGNRIGFTESKFVPLG
jgi:3-hydroxyacyl-CoA dehydrogenase